MILLRELLCFGEVAKHHSVTKAADKNGMKQSNVSNCIRSLEDRLNAKLFNRIHNGMMLNEMGKNVLELSCGIDNLVNRLENYNTEAFKVAGDICLWTSGGLGAGYISSCLPDFYMKYPDVHIDIMCSLDVPGSANGIDMAILYEKPKGNDVEIIVEHNLKFGLFASVEYLAKFDYPKDMKDLQENYKICTRDNYTSVWTKWNDFISGAKHVVASTNSSSMLMRLTKDGIGVALHPLGTASKEQNLIHLSKLKFELSHKFWVVARKETKNLPKIKALTDYIKNATVQL